MVKILLSTIMALTVGAQAHAVIIRGGNSGNNPPPPPPAYRGQQSIGACSDYLYQKLSIFSSTGDEVCSQRTDVDFQDCAIRMTNLLNPGMNSVIGQDAELKAAALACNNGTERNLISCTETLTPYFGAKYRSSAAYYCASARTESFGRCVGRLYAQGGLRPEESMESCNSGLTDQMVQCVTDSFQSKRQTGRAVINTCKDQYDPAAIARRQAEQERQRKEAEAKQKAAEEAKRQADEAKRKADEQKRKEEEDKKKQQPVPPPAPVTPAPAPAPKPSTPTPAPAPAPAPKPTTPAPAPKPATPAPAPQDPSDSGGGVIVDLPNF